LEEFREAREQQRKACEARAEADVRRRRAEAAVSETRRAKEAADLLTKARFEQKKFSDQWEERSRTANDRSTAWQSTKAPCRHDKFWPQVAG